MTGRDEIERRVVDTVAAALKLPVDAATRRADCAAWDSLRHIEVVFAVEDELDVRFDEAQLGALDGVAAIVDAVLALQRAGTEAAACATTT